MKQDGEHTSAAAVVVAVPFFNVMVLLPPTAAAAADDTVPRLEVRRAGAWQAGRASHTPHLKCPAMTARSDKSRGGGRDGCTPDV